MESLLNFRAASDRASRRKKRGEAVVDLISTLGLVRKTKTEGGFLIQGTNLIPELKTSFIAAPAGLVTMFSTFDGLTVFEADYFAEPIFYRDTVSGLDYLIKQFFETELGNGSSLVALLQGQPGDQILEAFPYLNAVKYQFSRTGSFFELDPVGGLNPQSYLYPNTWSTPAVSPHTGIEGYFCGTPGVDLIYNGSPTLSSEVEIRVANYISNGLNISPRTCFFEQYLWSARPSFSIWPQPVSDGYVSVLPVEYQYYNFQDGRRFYATIVQFTDGVLSYDRIYLDTLLPDPASVPETHTGSVMPEQLRAIVLNEVQSTARPQSFYSFSDGYDGDVILFNVIDLTSTDNTLNSTGPDVIYFQNNPSQRKWRLSCHFYNHSTGETWCFTADQFWDLLRQRVINLEIGESLEDAPSSPFNQNGWSAANNVLMHFFCRPNNHFHVPHDTWTFHGEDGDIYSWSRYYGNARIARSGIVGLESGDIVVPEVAALNDGVRPTIRYSQPTGETDTHRYLCVCEKLERLEPDEDLPQGQKEVLGIFVGTPFIESAWVELPVFDISAEEEVWTLCHVRVAYHEYSGNSVDFSFEESVMLLGIVRRLFVDRETEEQIIQYYSAYLMYNGSGTEKWNLSGRCNINTIDPVYGERWSADMTLFGDNILSRKMSRYVSPPQGASQFPCGPYSSYERGLP